MRSSEIRKDEATRDMPVIVISGHATVNDAVQAIKLGASRLLREAARARAGARRACENALEAAHARRALAEVSRSSTRSTR